MSLINKMLNDLDARGVSSCAALTAENICHDLRPVVDGTPAALRMRHLMLLALVTLVVLGGAANWGEWAPRFMHRFSEPALDVDLPIVQTPTVPNLLPTVTAIVPTVPALAVERLSVPETPASAPAFEMQTAARVDDAPPGTLLASVPDVVHVELSAPAIVDKKMRVLTVEQQAENDYQMALVHYRNKQSARAESSLRDVLNVQPAHLPARELLAGVMLESGRSADAMQVLVEGLAQTPSHYPFASMLAGVYLELGEESTALATLESAQSYAQSDADYRGFLAALYQRAHHHAEAIENYRVALSMKSFESKWWLGLGISYEAMHDAAAAENAFLRAQKDGGLTPALSRYADERIQEIRGRKLASPLR